MFEYFNAGVGSRLNAHPNYFPITCPLGWGKKWSDSTHFSSAALLGTAFCKGPQLCLHARALKFIRLLISLCAFLNLSYYCLVVWRWNVIANCPCSLLLFFFFHSTCCYTKPQFRLIVPPEFLLISHLTDRGAAGVSSADVSPISPSAPRYVSLVRVAYYEEGVTLPDVPASCIRSTGVGVNVSRDPTSRLFCVNKLKSARFLFCYVRRMPSVDTVRYPSIWLLFSVSPSWLERII